MASRYVLLYGLAAFAFCPIPSLSNFTNMILTEPSSLVMIFWIMPLTPLGSPSVTSMLCKGFIRPVAHIGSGDPVRVLCLYTTITLDEV